MLVIIERNDMGRISKIFDFKYISFRRIDLFLTKEESQFFHL